MKCRQIVVRAALACLAVAATALALAAPAQAYPPGVVAVATINATVFAGGDTATVQVQHATPRGRLTMVVKGAPGSTTLARGVVVDRDGGATISGVVPGTYNGSHALTVSSTAGEQFTFTVQVVHPGSLNVDCAPAGRRYSGFLQYYTTESYQPGVSYSLTVDGATVDTEPADDDGGLYLRATVTPVRPTKTYKVAVVANGVTFTTASVVFPCQVAA